MPSGWLFAAPVQENVSGAGSAVSAAGNGGKRQAREPNWSLAHHTGENFQIHAAVVPYS